jgi:hypothetical protein
MIMDELALEALVERAVRKAIREVLAERASPSDEYISVAAAARRIDVAPSTIRAWIGQGFLNRYHAGRELRVRVSELQASLASRPTSSVSPEEAARSYLKRRVQRQAR